MDRILGAAGLPALERAVSPRTALCAGWLLERLHGLLRSEREPRMTRWVARELATAHRFDLSATRRELGYEPSVTIAQGLERLAAWLRQGDR